MVQLGSKSQFSLAIAKLTKINSKEYGYGYGICTGICKLILSSQVSVLTCDLAELTMGMM